ncbi:hypothetical protein [Mycolicibacterium setense]
MAGQQSDADLLLARADGLPLSVRDYSCEFAGRNAAVLKAITLGNRSTPTTLGYAR